MNSRTISDEQPVTTVTSDWVRMIASRWSLCNRVAGFRVFYTEDQRRMTTFAFCIAEPLTRECCCWQKVARNTSTHNLYVALYGFKGRESDDLELR